MNKIKIALFEWSPWSLMSWLIMLATGCRYTHAAVCVGGKWFDASESRGTFDAADLDRLAGRACLVSEFDVDLRQWVPLMLGRKYDWSGVAGWAFCRLLNRACGNRHQWYCFEAVSEALMQGGIACSKSRAISARDILSVMNRPIKMVFTDE